MLEMELTTLPPTTTTVETTTIPISELENRKILDKIANQFLNFHPPSGYCVVQRPHTIETQYIAEGTSRRVSLQRLSCADKISMVVQFCDCLRCP